MKHFICKKWTNFPFLPEYWRVNLTMTSRGLKMFEDTFLPFVLPIWLLLLVLKNNDPSSQIPAFYAFCAIVSVPAASVRRPNWIRIERANQASEWPSRKVEMMIKSAKAAAVDDRWPTACLTKIMREFKGRMHFKDSSLD